VPGPVWDADDPADEGRILANVASLITKLRADASRDAVPSLGKVQRLHAACYTGCKLPAAGYAGHFRGDPSVPDLIGYEVGVGPLQPDGWPSKVGVPSTQVRRAVSQLLDQTRAGVRRLDTVLPEGGRTTDSTQLRAITSLAAAVHGEWVRIHPYANGNGRTARVWAAWVALRYHVPVFVSVKPRPNDAAYAIASARSMGRPPDFVGDHSLAQVVFADMLIQVLRP